MNRYDLMPIAAFALMLSLSSCQKEGLQNETVHIVQKQHYFVSSPLSFPSAEALSKEIESKQMLETKAASTFVSYEETVMQEADYYDHPWAIMSSKFASILNCEGEVYFSDKMLKVGKMGTMVGPQRDSLIIRSLINDSTVLSLCKDKTRCPYVKNSGEVYSIKGYSGVYFGDSFNQLAGHTWSEEYPRTKATDTYIQIRNENVFSLFDNTIPDVNWNKNFVVPPASQQRVFFSDNKYCNDTKIYQQDFIVWSGNGINTKTTKKGLFYTKVGAYNTTKLLGIVIHETANYAQSFTGMEVNTVNYAGTDYVILTKHASGLNPPLMTNSAVLAEIEAANEYAHAHGSSNISVQGIRYIVNSYEAYTRLPDQSYTDYCNQLELSWPMRFGGTCFTGNSLTHEGNTFGGTEQYYIWGITAIGSSLKDGEVRGTKMVYTFAPLD